MGRQIMGLDSLRVQNLDREIDTFLIDLKYRGSKFVPVRVNIW
jgi:hypothetical protein